MNKRDWILLTVLLGGCITMLTTPAFPQPQHYHHFADQRMFFGIPYCWDVLSNLAFFLAGWMGLANLKRFRVPTPLNQWLRWYCVSLIGVAAGSSIYHLAPDNHTLVWDRLPMTISFSLFFCLVIGSHLSVTLARQLLPVLLFTGISATGYWYFSELHSVGDVRFYAAFQFIGLAEAVLILALYPARNLQKLPLVLTVALYVIAKLCELGDLTIYEQTGFISGHTLKHLLSALGAFSVVYAAAPKPLARPYSNAASC